MQRGQRRTPPRTTRVRARSGAHAGAPPAPAPAPAWPQQLRQAQPVGSVGDAETMDRKTLVRITAEVCCHAWSGLHAQRISTAILRGEFRSSSFNSTVLFMVLISSLSKYSSISLCM